MKGCKVVFLSISSPLPMHALFKIAEERYCELIDEFVCGNQNIFSEIIIREKNLQFWSRIKIIHSHDSEISLNRGINKFKLITAKCKISRENI